MSNSEKVVRQEKGMRLPRRYARGLLRISNDFFAGTP
jgi:hypothetical protein